MLPSFIQQLVGGKKTVAKHKIVDEKVDEDGFVLLPKRDPSAQEKLHDTQIPLMQQQSHKAQEVVPDHFRIKKEVTDWTYTSLIAQIPLQTKSHLMFMEAQTIVNNLPDVQWTTSLETYTYPFNVERSLLKSK